MTVFSTSETSALVALLSAPANGMDFAVFSVIDTALALRTVRLPTARDVYQWPSLSVPADMAQKSTVSTR